MALRPKTFQLFVSKKSPKNMSEIGTRPAVNPIKPFSLIYLKIDVLLYYTNFDGI